MASLSVSHSVRATSVIHHAPGIARAGGTAGLAALGCRPDPKKLASTHLRRWPRFPALTRTCQT